LAGPVGGYRRGLRFVFASEVKADTDKSRALLKTVCGRSFQVVANLKWRPVAPRAFDLGRAELLSYDTVIRIQQEVQFAKYPHLIGLAMDAVFKDAESPAAGAEYLEEPRDDLFAGEVLDLDAGTHVMEGNLEWCRQCCVERLKRGCAIWGGRAGSARLFRRVRRWRGVGGGERGRRGSKVWHR